MARVLVVDDEHDITDGLVRSLEEADYEVTPAYSQKEASELLTKNTFDVIVTDMKMEEDDSGLKVVKLAQKLNPYVKIIILTAYPRVETAIPATKLGAEYITKAPEADIYQDVVEAVYGALKATLKACVLMPFSPPFDTYYPDIFKPALEAAGYSVTRADDYFMPRPIMLDIQKMIVEADLILCEMSGKNPNVFYELGLAHAIGKPAILVSSKQEDIPFDVRHVRVILYDSIEDNWKHRLKEAIAKAAEAVLSANAVWPPPLVS